MKTVLQVIDRLMNEKQDCVLVTITDAYGSTPGRKGAFMVVTDKGRQFGTIGGGAVELKSEELAKKLLEKKCSRLERFRLHQNEIADIGMICGGENDVYFCCLPYDDERSLTVIREARKKIAEGCLAWFATELVEGEGTALGLFFKEDDGTVRLWTGEEEKSFGSSVVLPETCGVVCADGRTFFARKLIVSGKVYLFGAGHISQSLAPLLLNLGFECGVYDDREEFLDLECFSQVHTEKIDPADISALASGIREADYVCIMTHGHKDDYEIQRQIMKTPARYIGVIGSARKQKSVKERLLAAGYAEEDFANVVSPIGLNIGADSPAEIAVCIAAQLIMVRSGRGYGEKDWKR